MNIETHEEVTRTVVLTLTEQDLDAALSDHRPLIKQLRQARQKWNMPANWATNGYAGHESKTKRNGAVRRGRPTKNADLLTCPGCGEQFSAKGLGPHKRRCPKFQIKKVAGTLPKDD